MLNPDGTPIEPVVDLNTVSPDPSKGPEGVSQSNLTNEELRKEVVQLSKRVSGLQSKVDKGEVNVDEKISGFEQKLERLGMEMTPEQKRDLQFIELQESVNKLANPNSVDGIPTPTSDAVPTGEVRDLAAAFQAAGIKVAEATPEQIVFVSEFKGTDVDLTNALLLQKAPAPVVDPATGSTVVQPQGTRPILEPNAKIKLEAEFRERIKPLQGDVGAITLLKQEFRGRGLDIA